MTSPADAAMPLPDLAACPFCGRDDPRTVLKGRAAYVECRGCGVATSVVKSDVDAIAAWNRRSPPSALHPTLAPGLSTSEASREVAIRCLDNLAIDTGAKRELIERIVAAMGAARREAPLYLVEESGFVRPINEVVRRAAIEECAKVADAYADSASRLLGAEAARAVQAARGIAGKLRALKPAEETK